VVRTVTAQEARQRLGELLENARRGDEMIIERAGRPMGVVISPLRYELALNEIAAYRREQRQARTADAQATLQADAVQ
jgi:prevent-host-death family protein